ncbi:MAG: hypothetical protein VXZ32_01390 [Verrucomicrobiota bacterium]|nr:hypothetical protein [Verrucomicrobiota bacterium]
MFFSKRTGSILSTALLLLFMGFIEDKHAFTIFPNDTDKAKAHEPRQSVLDIAVLGRQKGSQVLGSTRYSDHGHHSEYSYR